MNFLTPRGPFLLIMWDPHFRVCNVKGTLENKAEVYEMLERAKRTLDDHFEELAKQSLIEKPRLQIVEPN